ncbi:MAG: MFS transporter, partial [Proteobacteria bacterium]|nr:MFS transporter [Pseudomonadota bacterium]
MMDSSKRPGATIIIACGGLVLLLSIGIRNSFGIFLQPISAELGWSREVFALTLAIQNLFWGLSQPFAGMIADRYGSGRVMVTGATIYAAGLLLMSASTTPLATHITIGAMIGIGIGGCGFAIVLASVGRSVPPERRAMALGIASALGSFGQFSLLPLGQVLMDGQGWSVTFVVFGMMILLIVPLASMLSGRPAATPAGQSLGFREAMREAAGHSGYLYLNAGFFVCGFHVTFIATHLPAYVSDLGLAPQLGAWALGLVGLFNIVGSLLAGALGDRFSKKYLLSFLYMGRAVVIALFILTPPSTLTVLLFAGSMGLLWLSTVPLTSALVAQVFGTQYMSTLFGIVFLSHQIGAFLGAWLG